MVLCCVVVGIVVGDDVVGNVGVDCGYLYIGFGVIFVVIIIGVVVVGVEYDRDHGVVVIDGAVVVVSLCIMSMFFMMIMLCVL